MSVTGNFKKVTVRVNGSGREEIVVEGETNNPRQVQAIYVALARASRGLVQPPGQIAQIRSTARAEEPDGATWQAHMSQTRPKVGVGDEVLLIGTAVPANARARPVFWHQTVEIQKPDAVPR
jgi:hypothetical protein